MTEQDTTAADTGMVEAPDTSSAETRVMEDFSPVAGVDKGDDELLAQLDADEELVGMTPDEVEATQEPVEELKEESSEGGDEPEEVSDGDSSEVAEGDLERALSALRRDGLDKDMIENMSDDQVLALGLKRAKVQADTDDAYRRLKELEAGKESATEEEQTESEPSEPTDQPELLNLDSAVEPFSDLFGEDAGQALKGIQQATVKSIEDSVIAPMRQAMEQMGATLGNLMAEDSRRRMADEYPEIQKDEVFASVRDRAQKLAANGGYDNLDAVLWDAARLEFSDSDRKTARSLSKNRDNLRSNGQPMNTSRRMVPKGLSESEKDDHIIEMLESGMSREDVQRSLN
tara:strand:- start:63 stop:1097 length:1035 start_codon:yes stop_codon:yes gene_type:complete